MTQKLFEKIIVVDEISLTQDKLTQPEEFQEEFRQILQSVKSEKIVFVLDNLDRTTHEKSVELLTTVKTFLDEDKCIFLIPCDEDAIKQHIAYVHLKSSESQELTTNYADEFLRKFFNVIIRIPKSENLELDTYTAKLLRSTGIPEFRNNQDLEWVITSSYRSNPREIKQFINILSSSVILIKEKINSGDIYDKKILKSNVAFLAKMLIFKQKFPNSYREFENHIINEGLTWEDLSNWERKGEEIPPDMQQFMKGTDEGDHATEFMRSTNSIVPKSVELSFFITFNQSEEEKQLPGWSQFLKSTLNKDITAAKGSLSSFEKAKRTSEFDAVSSIYLKTNKLRIVRTQPFVSTISALLLDKPTLKVPKLTREIALQLPNLINKSHEDYHIRNIFSLAEVHSMDSLLVNKIAKSYIDLLINLEGGEPAIGNQPAIDIFSYVSEKPHYFDPESQRITNLLKEQYNKIHYLDLFRTSSARETFLQSSLNQFIHNTKEAVFADGDLDINNFLDPINWLSSKDLLNQSQFEEILKILQKFFEREVSRDPFDSARRKVLMDIADNYLTQYLPFKWELTSESHEILNFIEDKMEEWFGGDPNPPLRASILKLALTFWKHGAEGRETRLEERIIRPHIKESDSSDTYSQLSEEAIETVVKNFPSEFIEAAKKDNEVYNRGRGLLDQSQKDTFYQDMLDISPERTVILLMNDEYSSVSKVPILHKLYDRSSELSTGSKEHLLQATTQLKTVEGESLKGKIYQLLQDLSSTDEGKEVVSRYLGNFNGLFSKAEKASLK